MINWLKEAEQIEQEIIGLRRDIHRHPELGNEEFRTAGLIDGYLGELGIECRRVLDTGVIGVLRGRGAAGNAPGKTVAFRADMDALPVTEETGLPYASENPGVMHACGHDLHVAALLGAAKLMAGHRDELTGNVVFIFQPDEEGEGGAERILETGILDDLGVDAVFGAHCEPSLAPGTIGIKYGRFYASACKFDITVRGMGSHGAEPEKGTDSLYAAAKISVALKELTGYTDGERAVVTVGTFNAGTARNIISDHADITGILRTAGIDLRERKKAEIRGIVDDICKSVGVTADVKLMDGYVGVTNHDSGTELVKEAAAELLGADRVVTEEDATMTTEDFGFYLLKYPGAFYHIGVGSDYPLHSPKICPDESALKYAASVHAAVMEKYLLRG